MAMDVKEAFYVLQPPDEEQENATAAWQALLRGIHGIAQAQGQETKKVFISYAWPTDRAKTAKLQHWLKQLKEDLELAGMEVFLNVENMSGKLEETLLQELTASHFIIPILTPRFLECARDPQTNLSFEFRETLKKTQQDAASVLPILHEGGFSDVVRDELAALPQRSIYIIRDDANTAPFLVNLSDPFGLIPTIYGWNRGLALAPQDQQTYQNLLTTWLGSDLHRLHPPQRLPNVIEHRGLMDKLFDPPDAQVPGSLQIISVNHAKSQKHWLKH